jgi:drug/metabolite transporter (DMT)-like permease
MESQQVRRGYLLTLTVLVAFAIYPSVAPLGIAAGASSLGFVLAAMTCSLVGVSIVAILQGHVLTLNRSQIGGRVLLGAIFFLEHVCLLFALNFLAVPVAMSLIYTYPFMVGLASLVTGKTREGGSLFGTLVLCLIGVTMVLGFSPSSFSVLGVSFALAQAFLATARILLTAKLVSDVPGIVLTTQMLAVGTIIGAATACFVRPELPQSGIGWTAVLVAGCSGMIGHGCLASALQNIRPTPFAVIMTLEPVIAAILAAILVGQVLSSVQYLGSVLVVLSVIWYTYSKRAFVSV